MASDDITIQIAPAARREIKKLPKSVQKEIVAAIEGLGACPRPRGVEKISGHPDFLRIPTGNYRIIYTIRDRNLVIVLLVRPRKDAYRHLDSLKDRLAAAIAENAATEMPNEEVISLRVIRHG
jgi:mRNA interferase RelE/StbE